MKDAKCHSVVAKHVLLIRPTYFWANLETAATNHFQSRISRDDVSALAQAEFESLRVALENFGVKTSVFDSDLAAQTPDAVFPNNWFSTHSEGSLFLYPMEAMNRRRERRSDIIQFLYKEFGPYESVDLTKFEESGKFLEGTGSLVLDRKNKVAYCCLSSRSHPELLKVFEEYSGYSVVSFSGRDLQGQPIYHTNVMMSLGKTQALICLESIDDEQEKLRILRQLELNSQNLISLRLDQLAEFCGNILLLQNEKSETAWFMSQRALNALDANQKRELKKDGEIISVSIPTIENLGGGSVRCMIAEIFKAEASHSRMS